MKISKPMKIIIGLLTLWDVVAPFLLMIFWFGFIIFGISIAESQATSADPMMSLVIFPFIFLMICNSFLSLGLRVFYLVHVILNKTGNDVARVLLGAGVFFLPFIAMPFYYFVYILPQNPPEWALSLQPAPISVTNPVESEPTQSDQ